MPRRCLLAGIVPKDEQAACTVKEVGGDQTRPAQSEERGWSYQLEH